MKKKLISLVLSGLILAATALTACGKSEDKVEFTQSTKEASVDEILPAKNETAVEESTNVNGMRFCLTLAQFTEKYNQIKAQLGETDLLNFDNWQKNGDETTDENHTKIQYYYYNESDTNFTATVEVDSNKLLNVGCGTTTSRFMEQEGEFDQSNKTLEKTAIMAEAVCQFPIGSEEFLKNVFSQTTTNSSGSVWYQGFVFSLSTKADKSDSKNNIMLFRVFPVADELQAEWKLDEYGA